MNADPVIPLTTPAPVSSDERQQVVNILKELSTDLVESDSLSVSEVNLKHQISYLSKKHPMDILWQDVESVISDWRLIERAESGGLPDSDDKINRLEQLKEALKLRFAYPDVQEGEEDKHGRRTLRLTWRGRKYRDTNPPSKEEDFDVIESTCCIPEYETPARIQHAVERTTSRYLDDAEPPFDILWAYLRSVKRNINARRSKSESKVGATDDMLEKRFTTIYETLQTCLWSKLSDLSERGDEPPLTINASVGTVEDHTVSTGVPHLSESESSQVVTTLRKLLMPSMKLLLPADQFDIETLRGTSRAAVHRMVKSFQGWLEFEQREAFQDLVKNATHGSYLKGQDFLMLSQMTEELKYIRLYSNTGSGRSFRTLRNLHSKGQLGKTFSDGDLDQASNNITSGLQFLHGITSARKGMTFSVKILKDRAEACLDSDRSYGSPEMFSSLTFRCGSPQNAPATAFLEVNAPIEKVRAVVQSLTSGVRDPDNPSLERRFDALAGQINLRPHTSLSVAPNTTATVADSEVSTNRQAELPTSVHAMLDTIRSALSIPPPSQASVGSFSRKRPFERDVASSAWVSRMYMRLSVSADPGHVPYRRTPRYMPLAPAPPN